uniref:E3 ubiquitin protein ligase n=1 Tax=Sinocyclocheilus rhinocerous TaxID=307959 RepID=A0A673LIH8_9TELE
MSATGGGKRPSGGDSPPDPPEKKLKKEEKTTTTLIEPIRIGGVSSTEEMDMKVIQFKNKKLCERLEQRQALEDELREKIEKLEKRQATDDTTLLIVNRCWTQLEENIHELLQRVEPKDAPAPVQTPATPPVLDFPVLAAAPSSAPEPSAPLPAPIEGEDGLPQPPLSAEAVEEKKQQPVQEKEQTQEQEQQQQLPDSEEKPADEAMEDGIPAPPPPLSESAKAFLATLDNSSEEELTLQLQDRMQFSKGAVACMVCIFDRLHTTIDELCTRVQSAVCEDDSQRETQTTNRTLLEEHNRLQDLAYSLQGKHHKMSLETPEKKMYHGFHKNIALYYFQH